LQALDESVVKLKRAVIPVRVFAFETPRRRDRDLQGKAGRRIQMTRESVRIEISGTAGFLVTLGFATSSFVIALHSPETGLPFCRPEKRRDIEIG